jgi:ankyrin repeat protein
MRNDFEGYTPLHMMARQPNQELECAKRLLDAGADPTLRDAAGRTPLDVAIQHGREKTRQYLASLGQ